LTWEYHKDPRPDVQAVVSSVGRRFLDVGCAAGLLGAALKAAGAAHVAGVEAHPGAAGEARGRLDEVVEGDLRSVRLPFAPASFDYIVFADVLEHVPDPEAVLARYLPYLGADGRIVVSVPNMRFYLVLLRLLVDRWSYTDAGIRDRTHLRIFTRRSLLALLEGAGLRLERLDRNYRLLEDQSQIGLAGALATRLVRATLAPLLFRNLLAYQYVAVARRVGGP
jgi:2-polyprenyl-3-methyl-5-hydroxy-6-metoxy-1,4-benzoquinol methylase